MGKSSKAKKEKKADFTKVKLKVGKKLPKGQKFTDTSFKSKKIIINDKTKKQGGDAPVTKKKLTLKELLSHLQHYSAYVRQDGVTGLRELLTAHPELVLPSLGQILPGLAGLLVDEDQKLRSDAVTLISDLTAQVSEQQAAPFFPALVTHLTCAMTHIAAPVRQSALPFLAALLVRFPRLLAAAADHVLPTLLELISRGAGAGGGRALLADPASRLSAAAWRVTVLRQLAQLLAAQPERQPADAAGASGASLGASGASLAADEDAAGFTTDDPSGGGVPMYWSVYPRPAEEDGLLLLGERPGQERRLLRDPDKLREYVAALTPLLFQAYAEVAPDKDKDGSLLSDDAAETLAAILEVMSEILKQMRLLDDTKNTSLVEWWTEAFWPDLSRHVFTSFPYSRLVGRRKKKESQAPPAAELGSDAINVLVCQLAAGLARAVPEAAAGRHHALEYLTAYLESDRSGELERVCGLLRGLLDPGPRAAGPPPDLAEERACLRAAAARHAAGQQSAPLTRLLAAVITEPRLEPLARCEEVETWAVQLLSGVKFDADSLEVLVLLRRIAAMGRERLLDAVKPHAARLLVSAADAAGADGAVRWQRSVIELLFWPRDVAPDASEACQKFLEGDKVDDSVKRYAREVLLDKYCPGLVNAAV